MFVNVEVDHIYYPSLPKYVFPLKKSMYTRIDVHVQWIMGIGDMSVRLGI